jgi:cytoskeletal protein RodZ
MATRRKRNLNFLPAETRTEPVIDISAYPVDIGVGELMRLTRERLGHELQTVANQLRIRLSYLEAIEDARFRDLPGTTYAVGFVRSYADYLGLDGADIVRRFREEAARIHGQTKLVFPALTAEGKLPRAAVLLVSAIGLAGLYGVWYYISSRQQTELPVITEVPDRLVVLTPDDALETPPTAATPAETPAAAGESPATTPMEPQTPAAPVDSGPGAANAATPSGPAVEPPAPPGDVADLSTSPPAAPVVTAPTDSAPVADAAGSTAAASPSPSTQAAETVTQPATDPVVPDTPTDSAAGQPGSAAPAEATTGTAAAPVAGPAPPAAPDAAANDIPAAPSLPATEGQDISQQAMVPPPAEAAAGVVLEARMDSWIKVVDAKGKTVMQQVLKAGERYVVPDQPGLALRTGNAGGLDVIVGGRKAPPLGEVGAVLTKVTLDPSRLLDGTAVAD